MTLSCRVDSMFSTIGDICCVLKCVLHCKENDVSNAIRFYSSSFEYLLIFFDVKSLYVTMM